MPNTFEISSEKTLPNLNKLKVTALEKSPTGIRGLDEITFGGIPKYRPTVLVGTTGTGKTFMSMEYIIKGVTSYNEPGIFMTFEEIADELMINVSSLGVNIQSLIEEKKLYIEHLNIRHNEIQEVGKYNIEGLFVRLEHAIELIGAKRVVLDAFDTLFANFDTRILRTEFKRLFFWLKEKKVTAIITAESGDTFLTRLGLEENVADCVIELSNHTINQIGTRKLRIIKYRGSFHANNEYPFVIDPSGMTVFPIISHGLEQPTSKEIISSGIPELDNMLGKKGFFVGSSILISGTAGTGKTSIVSSFLTNACKLKSKCFFCAFEETPNQILRNMESIGISLHPYLVDDTLQFYYARPTLQNLELHFMAIKQTIEKIKPSIIILDPITNLMTEAPNSDVRSMLTRFIDYLKTEGITVMFTAAITIGSIANNTSDEGISSMVDTWISLEDLELNGERSKRMYLMKSRGMNHSKKEMELILSNTGVSLLSIDRSYNESVIGTRKMGQVLQQSNAVFQSQPELSHDGHQK